ncbi:endonuclease/reverse transcriptase, putative [Pediculus humanus corporis]|uniref:Endonuclease/reverse transcriptase, putative n=1 Tax=Pediculus humanus subsp. corporis TaxID=121224 RepID=E0VX34_PEDHC|nr:endonuclease/reverse transcriptase, putative [Pediculus humanus corporis]EEB17940.1 endonuclease/reverse transcriptase, putative [Pediculus humanus corporis]
MGKFLQINLNRCKGAQDLLLNLIGMWGVEIAMISEPHDVPSGGGGCRAGAWFVSEDGGAAIFFSSSAPGPRPRELSRGVDFVFAGWGNSVLVSVYASPNRPLRVFEDQLRAISRKLDRFGNSRPILVSRDFNAKHTSWSGYATNARGRLLRQWLDERHLIVWNAKEVKTCVRSTGGSTIDLTISSGSTAARVSDWEVISNFESLSNHAYVAFSFANAPKRDLTRRWRPSGTPVSGCLCRIRKLAGFIVRETRVVRQRTARQVSRGPTRRNAHDMARRVRDDLRRISDSCMKRIGSRSTTRKRPKYWWTDEIGELWKESCLPRCRFVGKKRQLIKQGGRYEDIANNDELARFKAEWRATRIRARRAIWSSKETCWKELLSEADSDPWGLPFGLVTNKLRDSSGPLTAGMTEEFLAEVIAELFPRVEPFAFPPPDLSHDANRDRDTEVTEGEVRLLLDATSKRRSAPDPNGVHYHTLGKSTEVLCALYTACFREATFPTPWKETNMVLLDKPGRDPTTLSAYRPICLLDVEGKLFERVIASRIDEHLRSGGGRNDLSPNQYGFRVAVRRPTHSSACAPVSGTRFTGAASRSSSPSTSKTRSTRYLGPR